MAPRQLQGPLVDNSSGPSLMYAGTWHCCPCLAVVPMEHCNLASVVNILKLHCAGLAKRLTKYLLQLKLRLTSSLAHKWLLYTSSKTAWPTKWLLQFMSD